MKCECGEYMNLVVVNGLVSNVTEKEKKGCKLTGSRVNFLAGYQKLSLNPEHKNNLLYVCDNCTLARRPAKAE